MKAKCDVVILSKASSGMLYDLTQQAIASLIRSEAIGTFNVSVMEQAADRVYRGANVKTVAMPGEFNYNRFANVGLRGGDSEWVCVANNDLIFHRGWFSALLAEGLDVMSPRCPIDVRQKGVSGVVRGYDIGYHFSGWCFVMRRSVWEAIGGFDEDFIFFCADNSVVEQLKRGGYLPALVAKGLVTHLRSATLRGLTGNERYEKTKGMIKLFNRKYGKNLFNMGV